MADADDAMTQGKPVPCKFAVDQTDGYMRTLLERHGEVARGIPIATVRARLWALGYRWPKGEAKEARSAVER